MTTGMDVLALPLDIQLAILRLLDHKSLLMISASTKQIRELFLHNDKYLMKHALIDVEEQSSIFWRPGQKTDCNKTCLPCYGCLKLLTKCHFKCSGWYSTSTRKGPRAFQRRCLTCQFSDKHALTGPSRVILDPNLTPGLHLYCAGCTAVTHMVPLSECGLWDHTIGISWKGFTPIVAADFRCIDCKLRRGQHDEIDSQNAGQQRMASNALPEASNNGEDVTIISLSASI